MKNKGDRRVVNNEDFMQDIYSRISETDQEVAGIKSSVINLAQGQQSMNAKLDGLANNQLSATRLQMAPIISFAALVFVVMAALFGVMSGSDSRIESASNATNTRIENNLSKLTDTVISHQGDGHPKVQQEAIKSLRINLARVEDASVTEDKLSSELKAIYSRLDSLTRNKKYLTDRADAHNQRVNELNASQWSGIKHNKEMLEKMYNRLHK